MPEGDGDSAKATTEERPTDAGQDSGRSVATVLQQIAKGELDPRHLSVEDRRACVAHLGLEGHATAGIAQLLKVSDRTVARDRRAIAEGNALSVDPQLADRVAGQLITEAQASVARLRRIGREADAPHGVRVEAERSAYQIVDSLVARLQSLGYLPSAAQRVQADLTHHLGDVPSLEELDTEMQRLRSISAAAVDTAAPSTSASPAAVNSLPPSMQEQAHDCRPLKS